MSKTKYYIDHPSKLLLPVTHFAMLWLVMDRFNAPQWSFAVYWTLIAICVIAQIYYYCTVDAKEVSIQDLLKKEHEQNEVFKKIKEKFEEDLRKQTNK